VFVHPGDQDPGELPNRLLKNTHLLRYAHPSSLQRTWMYASFLRISRALHLDVFEQPAKIYFFNNLLILFLPFFAGGFLYLRSSDLLPQAHKKSDPLVSIAFTLLGFFLIFVITRLVGV